MSWTRDQQNAAQRIVNDSKANAENELQALPYYQELVTRGISSGTTSLAASKRTIETEIANIQAQTELAKGAANTLQQAQQSTDLSSLNNAVGDMKSKVEKARTLQELRNEQANALANKYASNNYSPFLFFYIPASFTTPLSDVVRTGLYFVSLILLLIGGVVLKPLVFRGTSKTPDDFGTMVGGSRRRSKSNA